MSLSLISAFTLVLALASGQAESIKFGKSVGAALALPAEPLPPPGPVIYPAPAPAIELEKSQTVSGVKGGSVQVSTAREVRPILPAPVPAPILETTRYASPAYLPAPQPLTYVYLRPQTYTYQLGAVRYADQPLRPLLPADYSYVHPQPNVYRELTPPTYELPHPPPVGLVRETIFEGAGPEAVKLGKLGKLKSLGEKALGLLSFGSYHVAKEESFLPPPPISLLQPASIIEQQKEQNIVQEQEQIRDIDQQQVQVQEPIRTEQVKQQEQLPVQQQHDWSPRQQQQQQNSGPQQYSPDVDSNGFKRSSSISE